MCNVISSLWYEGAPRTRGAELDPFYYHPWKLHIYENSKWLRGPFQRHQNKKREESGTINQLPSALGRPGRLAQSQTPPGLSFPPSFHLVHPQHLCYSVCFILGGSWEPKNDFYLLHFPQVPRCLLPHFFIHFTKTAFLRLTLLISNIAYVSFLLPPPKNKNQYCRPLWCHVGTVSLPGIYPSLFSSLSLLFLDARQSIRFCYKAEGCKQRVK